MGGAAVLWLVRTLLPRIGHFVVLGLCWLALFPLLSAWMYRLWVHFPAVTGASMAARLAAFSVLAGDWFHGLVLREYLLD
jgi:hypothetical protein